VARASALTSLLVCAAMARVFAADDVVCINGDEYAFLANMTPGAGFYLFNLKGHGVSVWDWMWREPLDDYGLPVSYFEDMVERAEQARVQAGP